MSEPIQDLRHAADHAEALEKTHGIRVTMELRPDGIRIMVWRYTGGEEKGASDLVQDDTVPYLTAELDGYKLLIKRMDRAVETAMAAEDRS